MLVVLMVTALCQHFQSIQQTLWQQGYGLLTLGLLASACFAINRGDAWLQLANFLPYFLLVGVLHTAPQFKSSSLIFKTVAQAIILGSLPFSIAALVEYVVRFPSITARVYDWQIFQWVFDVNFAGHRAHGGLSHPNILSNYLIIVLGLGLGLLLSQLKSTHQPIVSDDDHDCYGDRFSRDGNLLHQLPERLIGSGYSVVHCWILGKATALGMDTWPSHPERPHDGSVVYGIWRA